MKLGQVKILDTINKVPGGLMVIPLILGVVVNTLFPEFLKIGSFTTALFKNGASALIAVLFLCSGAQIQFKSAGQALYKGIVLNTSKVLFGVSLGVILAKIGGPGAVFLGMTPLGLIGCMSNSNGGLYTALATKYGDKTDVGAIAVISSNDGPFYEMCFMGLAGVATIPLKALFACIFPIIVGMILGNLDDKMRDFLKPGMLISIFLFAFPLGAGMNFNTLVTAGLPGIGVGLLTVVWTGLTSYFVYRLLIRKKNRRSCAVGAAVGTSAGNSVATPAAIAAIDPTWAPYAAAATAQCAASVIVTAIVTPFVVNALYKYEEKKGLINYDVPLASEEETAHA
ncbi:2-keto-3-deoxygluconate permease [Treponema sp. OMZ 840]|uniref:2-keto-3-deoxygluconate permease n=1 Tax=Treponema sp. OMZ 840 TaxID=244313 RepID=UPI003D8D44A0